MSDDIPQWAQDRADDLADQEKLAECAKRGAALSGLFYAQAFARYIASKEEPPVDPLEAAIKETWPLSLAELFRGDAAKFRDNLAKRGLQIVEADNA